MEVGRFAEEVELEVRMGAVGRVIDEIGAGPSGYPTFLCFQARCLASRADEQVVIRPSCLPTARSVQIWFASQPDFPFSQHSGGGLATMCTLSEPIDCACMASCWPPPCKSSTGSDLRWSLCVLRTLLGTAKQDVQRAGLPNTRWRRR